MRNIIIILSLLWIAYSCNTPLPKQPEFEHLKSEKRIYASNDSAQPYMTLSMEFTYLSAFTNDTLLANIQKIFVVAFAGEDYAGRSPKGAFDAYEKEITDESLALASDLGKDIPDFSEYYQKIKTEVVDTAQNIITAKTTNENYMGGAHGAYYVFYYNIDTKTAKLLTEENFFKPDTKKQISGFIYEGLQSKYGNKLNEVLFESDNIEPNGNFYFGEKGLVYVFNEYEIAPYSEGLIEVIIPYEKIRELIMPSYINKIG